MKNKLFKDEIGHKRPMKRPIVINGRDEASLDQNDLTNDQGLRWVHVF